MKQKKTQMKITKPEEEVGKETEIEKNISLVELLIYYGIFTHMYIIE